MATAIWKLRKDHDQQVLHCTGCGRMLQTQVTNDVRFFTCNCGVWAWNAKKKVYQLEVV